MRVTRLLIFIVLLVTVPIQTRAADFIVNDATTLIDAINTANTNNQPDTITLSADITLTNPNNTTINENGLPVILADGGNALTIEGAGFSISRDTTAPDFRIMYIDTGATVTLNDITLSDGSNTGFLAFPARAGGGAIYNVGTLTLDNSTLIRNIVRQSGGAIFNDGTLTLQNGTTIGGDSATDGNQSTQSGGSGGGIFGTENSTLIIDASFIYGNTVVDGPGGGLFTVRGSTTTIRNGSRIGGAGNLGNTAGDNSGGGGALSGTVNISNSTVEGNVSGSVSAFFGGGGFAFFSANITMNNVLVTGNSASNNDGGGLLVSGSNLTMRDSTVTGNNASSNADAMTINFLADSDNVAQNIPSNYTIDIQRSIFDTDNSDTIRIHLQDPPPSAFQNNSGGDVSATINLIDSALFGRTGNGSGITLTDSSFFLPPLSVTFERNFTLNVTNTTFANFSGYAFRDTIDATSTYLDTVDTNINFNNVTIANVGSGLEFAGETSGAGTRTVDVNVSNSFIEGTSLGTNDCIDNSVGNPITFIGNNNLSTGTACSGFTGFGFTNTTNGALNLSSLADNGGQTQTVALNAGSSAIDGSGAGATSIDQRGASAVSTRDIGAYEADSTVPTITFTVSETFINETTGTTSATVDVTVANYAGQPIDASFIFGGSAAGDDYNIVGSTDLTFNANGTQSFTIEAIDDAIPEGNETLNLEIFITGNATLIGDSTATITITDVIDPEADNAETTNSNPDISVFDPAISKLGLLVPGQTGVQGEQLEWVVTVSNVGTADGTNVVVTDTLIDNLQIDSVEAVGATNAINGQTVSVTYPSLAVGETVTFSIFTTVIDGATVNNTACVTSDTTSEECATATAISQLPATGETPPWRLWLTIAIGMSLLGLLTAGIRRYRLTL